MFHAHELVTPSVRVVHFHPLYVASCVQEVVLYGDISYFATHHPAVERLPATVFEVELGIMINPDGQETGTAVTVNTFPTASPQFPPTGVMVVVPAVRVVMVVLDIVATVSVELL